MGRCPIDASELSGEPETRENRGQRPHHLQRYVEGRRRQGSSLHQGIGISRKGGESGEPATHTHDQEQLQQVVPRLGASGKDSGGTPYHQPPHHIDRQRAVGTSWRYCAMHSAAHRDSGERRH